MKHWMKIALIVPVGALLMGISTPVEAGDRDRWSLRADRLEDRWDRREDRWDRRRGWDRRYGWDGRFRHGARTYRPFDPVYGPRVQRRYDRRLRRWLRWNGYRWR